MKEHHPHLMTRSISRQFRGLLPNCFFKDAMSLTSAKASLAVRNHTSRGGMPKPRLLPKKLAAFHANHCRHTRFETFQQLQIWLAANAIRFHCLGETRAGEQSSTEFKYYLNFNFVGCLTANEPLNHQTISINSPVLSAKCSDSTPSFFCIATNRFDSGVSSVNLWNAPCLNPSEVPPASTSG